MYVDVVRRHFLFLISRHNFIASPRANHLRYQKSLYNLASTMSWDHGHRVWWQSVGNPQRILSNSKACIFITDLNSRLPMTCSVKFGRLNEIYMCTEFHMKCMCELYIKFSDCVPCAMPGSQPLRRPNGRRFQYVCQFSRVFDHVKAPKCPG